MQQKRNTFELLGMAGIKPDRLPLTLNMNEIESLCYSFKEMCDRDPLINDYICSDVLVKTLAYQEQQGFFTNLKDDNNRPDNLVIEED